MFGRRPDGIKIKGFDPVMMITPYLMTTRCDSQVVMKHNTDMEILSKYIRKQKIEKNISVSHMQIVIAAFVRALGHNPLINRFVIGKSLYARNNCSISFTILKKLSDPDQGEAVVKIKYDLTDTIYDVGDRINSAIEANRKDAPQGANKLLKFLFSVPGLPPLVIGVFNVLDRFGLAPKIMIDSIPFYATMYITNTASLGLHDVIHHIYNWGNVGSFFSIGMTEKKAVLENGEVRMKPYMPISIVVDERVCSGAHYAQFFSEWKRYLNHPWLLETPPETVVYDQGVEYHEPKVKKEEA